MEQPERPARSPWAPPDDDAPTTQWGPPPAEWQQSDTAHAPETSGRRRRWPIAAACAVLLAGGGVAVAAVAGGGGDDDNADQGTQLLDVEPVTTTSPTVGTELVQPATPDASVAPATPDESVAPATPDTSAAPTTAAPTTAAPIEVAPGTFSLELAVGENASQVPQRMRMTTSTMGIDTVVDAVIDSEFRMEMTMSAESLPGGSIDTVMDVDGGFMYYRGGPFAELLEPGMEWLAMDLETILAETGQSLDGMRQNLTGMPPNGFADTATQVGLEEVDGVQMMHYRAELDSKRLQRLIEENPQFAPGGATSDRLSEIGDVVYDLYITEQNTLGRMEMSMTVSGLRATSVYEFLPVEPGYVVQLPDPATVQAFEF